MFWLDTTILRLQNRKCLSEWVVTDSRYKHEVLVDGEPVLFEILDTCPKVQNLFAYSLTRVQNKFSLLPFPVNSKQKLRPKLYLTQVFEKHFISKWQQTIPRNKKTVSWFVCWTLQKEHSLAKQILQFITYKNFWTEFKKIQSINVSAIFRKQD